MREIDANGLWFTRTKLGKIYETLNPSKLIDGGFHNYSNKQIN